MRKRPAVFCLVAPQRAGDLLGALAAHFADDPAVTVLVDHYEDDWSRLWWVRFDGRARIIESGPEHASAIAALCAKYEQYRATPPSSGTVVAIDVTDVRSWAAS